ncbi:PrsW family intramembrane metalloprotease [Corynebacterium silvaticum]|nr:PrsW family intramembrane metalloprotease [Corynebacterium silvaticum]NOM65299.1 PrsW family intramembrane metalloprotease [Corynebacterium silvaticum]NON70936.1 PrsW family intramembrane metalloprotease [Corynebacterium silvaticum]TFA92691.1 PrsW family intramembrane metalloprotease [Corynebacterium silvaticum]TFA96375.1 PrsW family intramembrane metalloprotease [Corynebacterium silvaticum]
MSALVGPVKPAAHPTSISWVMWAIIGISTPVSLFFLGVYVLLSPSGSAVGLLCGAAYLVVGTLIFRVSPMWPKAGWKWYLTSLGWGACSSFALVMASAQPIIDLTDKLGWKTVSASFGGAYPEEISKALGVLLILFTFSKLSRPWHGFVTGGIVGLGFEVFENLMYGVIGGMSDANSDAPGALVSWGLRSIAGPGLHVFFTAIAGYGIGLAVFTYGWDRVRRFQVAGVALLVAFVFHFCWNLTWDGNLAAIINVVVVSVCLYPLVIYLWIRCHRDATADLGVIRMPSPLTLVSQVRNDE